MRSLINSILCDYELGRDIDLTMPVCRPDLAAVEEVLQGLQILVFPGFFRRDPDCAGLERYIAMVLAQVRFQLETLLLPAGEEKKAGALCLEFLRQIPRIRADMQLDLEAFLAGDPAATGVREIVTSYPGYYAIFVYRVANALYRLGAPVLPRMMTELAHSRTGIDIHPGAEIAGGFFIDHGTGVVIGQTTTIAAHVRLYQGVTLGALSTRKGRLLQGVKRHPTIESGVTIYAGATILGGETVIGSNATIGANAFLTSSVPAGSRIHGPGL